MEVETDEGPRIGSSIFEQSVTYGIGDLGYGYDTVTRGEAAWVDLPGGRNLLALLVEAAWDSKRKGFLLSNAVWPVPILFARHWGVEGLSPDNYIQVLKRIQNSPPGTGIDLSLRDLPLLATLPNPKAPVVALVDPTNLSSSLGQGIRLKRATLETTDAPLAWTFQQRLPWLKTRLEVDVQPGPPVADTERYLRLNATALLARG